MPTRARRPPQTPKGNVMEEYERNTFLLYHIVIVGSWRAWCCKKYIHIYERKRYVSTATMAVVHTLLFLNSGPHSLNYASTRKKIGLPYLLSGLKGEAIGLVLLRLEEEFSELFCQQ